MGGAGLFWWQIGRTDTVLGARNANGLIFFAMLFLAFATMFVALFTFPNEYKVAFGLVHLRATLHIKALLQYLATFGALFVFCC